MSSKKAAAESKVIVLALRIHRMCSSQYNNVSL